MTVYFISGQAADEKIFEKLALPSHIHIRNVHWIEPLKNESLTNYCKRLSDQIEPSKEFVLVGVSFGGIVSVELSKIVHPIQTIIISSIATKHELRPLFKFFNLLKLQKIVPSQFYRWYTPILNWYFGTNTEREKELLHLYTKSSSKNYMKWAVNQILNWKNTERPANLFHIHGTEDRIFPHQKTNADMKIKGGTHLMIHNRANEISTILTERFHAILQ